VADSWHIIGRGSIGLLWASALVKLGHEARLIVKTPNQPTTSQSIELTQISGKRSSFDVLLTAYTANDPIKVLLVPLKAYDVLPAIEQIEPRITPQTQIILCHNGMGTIEKVQALLGPHQPLLFATTTHGAYRLTPKHVVHSGLGETKIGWISPSISSQLHQTLNDTLKPVSWHDDIKAVLWQKLAINCVINPLTAVHQCQNGFLANAQFNEKISVLCQEISLVANANGIPLQAQEVSQIAYQVIEGTAKNYSSMNQDVKAGRPTEIDYITGYLIDRARHEGILVPANEAIFHAVKALQTSK
jgi:2-dehydropantoate 2-reductase